MPYNRPGNIEVDVTATKQVNHGDLCFEEGKVGVAVKTLADAATAGLVSPKVIAVGELFNMIIKGTVQVANGISATRGAAVYMTKATNALTLTGPASSTVARVGVVSEVAGQRGTPTGKMRINLDAKDQLL
jgi:hypothetical protein